MRGGFSLLRKWFWRWRAVPPWHVTVKIVGAVTDDCGEILDSVVCLSEGKFKFRFPDQCQAFPSEGTVEVQVPDHTKIDIHTEVKDYE